ncbi:hypothetical protein SCT_1464 [Sulfuricella sp. T08]|uniref:hypothetical protein n=1 Tax=Sulfuricella sp. T08 TaxID=1632857 RepID=UPI00061799A7|nr:hypothetical protein [Sulfuricella sp. T08]GAO36065.1 hypothetical protein SCT_1464 [Sulfuricella sp. T08]
MRNAKESITPEVVIRMLAYGTLAGIAVIVIYSAQALYVQPAAKAPPPASTAQTMPAAATTAPAASPAAPPGQPAAPSDKPLQAGKAAPAGAATPEAARPEDTKTIKDAPKPESAPAGKAAQKPAPEPEAAVRPAPMAKAMAVLGTGLLLAGSALLGGAFLGFLFGIPRSLQQQSVPESASSQSASATTQGLSGRATYGANTSLEQISDWLTKILVGVGLTQLTSLPSALTQFADFANPGLGGFETSGVFAVALLVYFLICGFLMSYLWTRLRLGKAFSEADTLAVIRSEIAIVSESQKKAQEQLTIDYEALRLTEKQLESGDVSQEELDRALRGTSDLYRTNIYQQAGNVRRNNWRDPKKKAKMERTIPIFRALIATDEKKEKERFHQNYAQLGYALAEASTPDYKNALGALNKAIELRGPAETQGYLMYEFVRAKCLADPDHPDPNTKEQVLKDLRVALQWPELTSAIGQDERLSAWLKANHVSMKSLLQHTS